MQLQLLDQVNVGNLQLSSNEVHNALLAININKGKGPDNIPPILLNKCAHGLRTPLTSIFNLSLGSGIFPDRWKTSYVTPVFKSGSRTNVMNYRGIAILPTIAKLFESIVTNYLTFKVQPIISLSQHAFIKKRSTSTNLIEFTNYVNSSLESGSQVDVIYTDFSKAFDKIQHRLIIGKLYAMGIHSSVLKWIESYLTGRKQYVNIMGVKSRTFEVTSGVPQGSHLGPLLFVLFINDVVSNFFYSKCLMYADDLKIFCRVDSFSDAIKLQHDVDNLSDWCQLNCLYLNIGKCKALSFYKKRVPINFNYSILNSNLEKLSEIRDLGVFFDSNLSFIKHIELKIAKAYSLLGFVKRICADFTNIIAVKSIYCAYVRSQLEFASVVWSPQYDIHKNRIESIQKKFLLFALRHIFRRDLNFALPPYMDRCEILNIDSLSQRRDNAGVLFMYDLLQGNIDAPNLLALVNFNVPLRRLRSSDLLNLSYRRTNYGRNEPIHRICELFNDIDFDFGVSRSVFCNRIRLNKYNSSL